jgi:hypothetical protein
LLVAAQQLLILWLKKVCHILHTAKPLLRSPSILRNPKVHKRLSLDPTLRQMNPVHALPSYTIKINFNTPSTLLHIKLKPLLLGFSPKPSPFKMQFHQYRHRSICATTFNTHYNQWLPPNAPHTHSSADVLWYFHPFINFSVSANVLSAKTCSFFYLGKNSSHCSMFHM